MLVSACPYGPHQDFAAIGPRESRGVFEQSADRTGIDQTTRTGDSLANSGKNRPWQEMDMRHTATFIGGSSCRERTILEANKRANDHYGRAGDGSKKNVVLVTLEKGAHEMAFIGSETGRAAILYKARTANFAGTEGARSIRVSSLG